jgi:hypothetical protein
MSNVNKGALEAVGFVVFVTVLFESQLFNENGWGGARFLHCAESAPSPHTSGQSPRWRECRTTRSHPSSQPTSSTVGVEDGVRLWNAALVIADLEDYIWAGDDVEELVGLTLTWTRYRGPIDAIFEAGGHGIPSRRFRSSITDVLWSQTLDSIFGEEGILIDRIGEWVLFIAPNGWEYSSHKVVTGVSRLGRVVSVFWNVEAVMQVLVADSGRITRDFDPLLYDPVGAIPEEAELPFGDVEAPLKAASLVFAERLTGERLTLDFLFRPHDGVIIERRT